MSYYHKGNAHKIPVMASKSCNAVSARDLYVPLTASDPVITSDAEGYRHYSITVSATCFFGTRIGIESTFSNMKLNGESVPDNVVDAYVKGTEPGYEIATITITGDYRDDGVADFPTRTVEFSGNMTYYSDVGCRTTKTIAFSNVLEIVLPNIEPYYTAPEAPTIDSVTAIDTGFYVDVSTASFGRGGGKALYVEASKTSDFSRIKTSNPIDTETGRVLISSLQQNTKYYLRAVAANNGLSTNGEVEEHATLAASMISQVYQYGYNGNGHPVETVKGITFSGGNANPVTIKVQYSTDKGVNWYNSGNQIIWNGSTWSTNAYTNGDTKNVTVWFRVATTTAAGTHYSAVAVGDVPAKDTVAGYIESVTLNGNQLQVKYHTVGVNREYTTTTFYYRQAGMEDEWKELGTAKDWGVIGYTRTKNFTINDILNNYVEYEISLNIEGDTSHLTFDTYPVSVFSIPTQVHNDTCESLDYLVQLICQTLNAIKSGNITIYMNNDTKEWCEGEDGVPTLASIMSRINRYMHTVGCILCSMEGFLNLIKESDTNQVYMGQLGWVDCDDEPIEGSMNPVLSDGIHAAIDELIKQVWHYMGDYDYFARNPLELNAQSGTATGQTAVLGDKVYTWNGSSWVSARDVPHEDFGVIHINSGRYADHAFYWFVNDWNRLDADTDEIEARLEALESLKVVQSIDGLQYKIALADSNLTKAQINALIPTDATMDTVIVLTDPALEDETQVTILEGGN